MNQVTCRAGPGSRPDMRLPCASQTAGAGSSSSQTFTEHENCAGVGRGKDRRGYAGLPWQQQEGLRGEGPEEASRGGSAWAKSRTTSSK